MGFGTLVYTRCTTHISLYSFQDLADPSLVLPGTTRAAQLLSQAQLPRLGTTQPRHTEADAEALSHVNHIAEGVLKAGRPIFGAAGNNVEGAAVSDEDTFVSDLQKAAMLAEAGSGRTLATSLQHGQADAHAAVEAVGSRQVPEKAVPHAVKLLRGFEAVGHVVEGDVATAATLRKGGVLTTVSSLPRGGEHENSASQ